MHFVVVGDPGVGKSSILNALVGDVVFDSGISYGSGRTQCLQTHVTSQGDRYSDTAGLGDTHIMKKAELEVTKALRLHPKFKLVFIVTPGTKSAVSINKVLDSVKEKITYGIIVNKMSKRAFREVNSDPTKKMEHMKRLTDSLRYATPHIHFYQLIPDLDDEDNKLHEPTPELKSFLEQLPANHISRRTIEKARDKRLEKLHAEARRKTKKATKELEKMRRKEAKAQRQQELERAKQERRLRAKLEAERKKMDRQHRRILKRARREHKRLQQERLERERLEGEHLREEQIEAFHQEQEKIHQEQLAAQQRVLADIEWERQEQERRHQLALERQRRRLERRQLERLERERLCAQEMEARHAEELAEARAAACRRDDDECSIM